MSVAKGQDNTGQLLLALLMEPVDRVRLETLIAAGVDWVRLQQQARDHQVLPQVYQGLKAVADRVPQAVLASCLNLHAANTLRNLQLSRELQRVLALFQEAGLAVIPYKGPILAEEVYGDGSMRSYTDLDLLVAPEHAHAAVQLLQAHGYRLDFALDKDRWPSLLKAENQLILSSAEQPCCVEIHWQLFHRKYAFPFDLASHWERLQRGAGRLTAEETLVMLCAHGTKHHWQQCKWLVDIDRLLASTAALDWPAVFGRAERSHAKRSLLLGLALAQRTLGSALPQSVREQVAADTVVASLAEEVFLRFFQPAAECRAFGREGWFLWRCRESLRDRVALLLGWLFWPRLEDWLALPLGDRCFALFFAARPVRRMWNWLADRQA